ncbi:MAG: GNAT family N-acetyltransferase [Chloroflexota bacterium]
MIAVAAAAMAEAETAFPLLVRFYAEEGFNTPAGDLRRNLEAFLFDDNCWVALAWRDGQAVGLATVSTARSTEDGLLAEIQDLYVLPEARGAGVARGLVAAALDWSAGRGCRGVEVVITPEGEASHRLSGFYAKLGFESTGRMIHTRGL